VERSQSLVGEPIEGNAKVLAERIMTLDGEKEEKSDELFARRRKRSRSE